MHLFQIIRPGRLAAIGISLLCLQSCLTPVPFHQRRALSNSTMTNWGDPLETHWMSKVVHSMEGGVGDVGTSGGGGCGCY